MANILGIFTAIILTVAAYVAFKNNARFEEEIETLAEKKRKLTFNQNNYKELQAKLNALPIERAEVDAQFTAKTKVETGLKDSNAAMSADIEDKTARKEANTKKHEDFRVKVEKAGIIKELGPELKVMRTDLEELVLAIDKYEAALTNIEIQDAATAADAKKRKENLDILASGESLPSLKTSIRSIYPTWGFVTLNAGNNAGVTATSTLDVVRDGATIAKLLVTSVESRSASASIIPDSIAHDVTLMVGDRVETSKTK